MKQYFTHKWLITATSFILISSSLISGTAFAGTDTSKPSRERILTALRLMSNDYQEYLCAKEIIRKESNFRTDARNGSHYGLAQGRSQYLRTATYTQQLAWFYRYTRSRYGEACRALRFHEKNNHY